MDTLRQDFFDATASRQGFRSDHGQSGSWTTKARGSEL